MVSLYLSEPGVRPYRNQRLRGRRWVFRERVTNAPPVGVRPFSYADFFTPQPVQELEAPAGSAGGWEDGVKGFMVPLLVGGKRAFDQVAAVGVPSRTGRAVVAGDRLASTQLVTVAPRSVGVR